MLLTRSCCSHRCSLQDDLRFLRIRTKRHELMITPGAGTAMSRIKLMLTFLLLVTDELYILVVVQDPTH